MYDIMVNHISAHSSYYLGFKEKKDHSPYRDFFIRYKDFWENGEPTREQIDLDVSSPHVKDFIKDTIRRLGGHGASAIRLDAFAYAIKKADSNCFFVEPEIWDLLYSIQNIAAESRLEILSEIHEHYSIQMKLAGKGFWVYDFALPMLVLHALYTHRGDRLKHWLDICPRKQMTTLDTHDGIGIVDVVDLLTPEEIEETKELLYEKGANHALPSAAPAAVLLPGIS